MNDTADRLRVLSVDDHAAVQHGLALVLMAYEDMDLVGQATSGEDAIRQCAEEQPDIVLMDLVMPGMGGAAATQQIRRRWPHTQVIALTNTTDPELLHEAMQAGAARWLPKTVSAEDLIEAIRAVYYAHSRIPQPSPVSGNGYHGRNGGSQSIKWMN